MFLFAAQQLVAEFKRGNFFDGSTVRKEFRNPFAPGALQAGHFPEEKTNATRHHTAHYTYRAARRRTSDVALQWRVGILSLRRSWPRFGDRAHSSSSWENLTQR